MRKKLHVEATNRLVDLVVFDQQDLVVLATHAALEFFKDKLLADNDLLCAVLIAIRARLTLFLWVEDDGKLRRFERTVDELEASIHVKLLVVIDRCFFDQLLLLGRIRDYDNGCVPVRHGAEDLVHDGVHLGSVVQHENNMGE